MPYPSSPPLRGPTHLLTVAEYLELGETEPGYSELVEGRVVLTPSQFADHNHAAVELLTQVRSVLHSDLEAAYGIDVDLDLVPPDRPGFSRRPDLVVVSKDFRPRQRREGGMARASEVSLVVEVLSPGSLRTDQMIKRGEYADAGIPHYWIVDIAEPASMVVCRASEFGYVDDGALAGRVTITAPFLAEIDLDALL